MAKGMKAMKGKAPMKVAKGQRKIRIPGKMADNDPRNKDAPKTLGKIRVGVVWGKVFDPVRVGAQDRDYPTKMRIKNNTGPKAAGWGGQFMLDVNTGLKIQRIAPDIFDIDFMTVDDVNEKRLAKNHINFNFWGCMSVAFMEKSKEDSQRVCKAQKNTDCRHVPQWDEYQFITFKTVYMKALEKAGIPIIDSILLDHGFDAKKVLKQIQKKGWEKFLIKPAYMSFFSAGLLNGNTADFVKDIKPMLDYEKEHKDIKYFLVQPYVLKPNGEVFDEIRNYIINGEWSYSVFTHGTDDNAVYEQPAGPLKDAARDISLKAYEVLKQTIKWEGVPVHSLLTRIDVGVMPDPLIAGGWRVFINELEPQLATWLGRYCPFELSERMASACVTQLRNLLKISLQKRRKIPDVAKVQTLLQILDGRLGPAPSVLQ